MCYLIYNKSKGKSKNHTFDDEYDDEDDEIENNPKITNEDETLDGLVNKDIE